MRARLIAILSISFLLATLVLVAQDIPPDELFWTSRPYTPEIASAAVVRVQTNLVEVPTVVLDSHEKPVGNLKKSDFLLFDNGKPQTISTFSVLTEAGTNPAARGPGAADAAPKLSAMQPRYVALFFDDMNTTTANLTFAREAATKFLRKGLDPGERVGIFTASGILSLDFTDDVRKLLDTLAKLQLFRGLNPVGCANPYEAWVIMHMGAHTPEWDDVNVRCCLRGGDPCVRMQAEWVITPVESLSLDTIGSINHVIKYLGQMPGRRIFLLTSSGFLTLSFVQKQQKLIEAALSANVVINSLDTAGVVFDDRFGTHFNLKFPLSDLALGTGGRLIQNNNDLEAGMHALTAIPTVSYMLGFSPENLRTDGSKHNLKVKLAEPSHLIVNARPAYYAPSPELSPVEKRFAKLQQSVLAVSSPAEIPIEFTAIPEALPSGESSLKVVVHVDIRKLPFEEMADHIKIERLIFITALFDQKNQFLTGVQGVMDLRLKESTLKQIAEQGLSAKLSVNAPAGSYRVRQVVQEAVGGHITAISRSVEIHQAILGN
jgi:VWFA-related protein